MIQLKNIELREYQKTILDTCRNNNTLVVLDTGLGKTALALSLAVEKLSKPNQKEKK